MSGLLEFDKRREVFRFVEDVCCAGGGFDERQMVAIPAIVGGLFVDGLCVGGTSDQAGSCRALVSDKGERASGTIFRILYFLPCLHRVLGADATSVHFAVQAVVFEGDGFVLLFGRIRAIKNRPVFYVAFFKCSYAIISHGRKKFPGFMRLIYFNPGRRRVHIYLNLPT